MSSNKWSGHLAFEGYVKYLSPRKLEVEEMRQSVGTHVIQLYLYTHVTTTAAVSFAMLNVGCLMAPRQSGSPRVLGIEKHKNIWKLSGEVCVCF